MTRQGRNVIDAGKRQVGAGQPGNSFLSRERGHHGIDDGVELVLVARSILVCGETGIIDEGRILENSLAAIRGDSER